MEEISSFGLREDGTSYNVLLVDDSIFVINQLTRILKSQGFEIIDKAGDGQEGYEKYKENHPNVDLVTLDITMPTMDGITALKKILDFDKNAKIVMISAIGKEDLVKNALMIGAKNFIVKPLDRDVVLKRIKSVITGINDES